MSGAPPSGGRGRPLRVAVLITRLEGGAGILALRGAMALDPRSYQLTIITGQGSSRLLSRGPGRGTHGGGRARPPRPHRPGP